MDNNNEARNHHWVPQCYLKGFAKSRSKKAKLHVIDAMERKAFQTNPRNVAAARDFNRIEIPEFDPNLVENGMSGFEGQADNALKQICAKRDFSDADDRTYVFNLIALLAIRNPRRREGWRKFQEDVSKLMMEATVATKERYESSIAGAIKDGFVSSKDNVSYEQMHNFVKRGEYTIEVPTTEHVIQEMKSVDTILPLLFQRNWRLIIAESGSGGFVTSDHPVILRWMNIQDRGAFYSPGFGLPETEIIFPISHEMALVGTFEGKEAVIEVGAQSVAFINGIIIAYVAILYMFPAWHYRVLGCQSSDKQGSCSS